MKYKDLGQWCKFLEKNFSNEIMIPKLPVIIRFDGNNFSSWTKELIKPFDEGLTDLMIETSKFLVKETNAVISYHQSDEITLILFNDDKDGSIYHEGKKQKILSKLTSNLVNFFNEERKKYLPNHNKIANFDCRIYQVPTLDDAVAQLVWRENDATRNSKQMLASAYFSHNTLLNVDTSQMQDMLMLEKGINWNDLPSKFKRGTYVKRIKINKPFTLEEIDLLPEKHTARKNPNIVIERNIISVLDLPPINKISNKVDVIFNNAEPLTF